MKGANGLAVAPDGHVWISGGAETLSRSAVRSLAWRYRWFTLMVVARIHWQALRLWFKRVPFFTKPAPPETALTR